MTAAAESDTGSTDNRARLGCVRIGRTEHRADSGESERNRLPMEIQPPGQVPTQHPRGKCEDHQGCPPFSPSQAS